MRGPLQLLSRLRPLVRLPGRQTGLILLYHRLAEGGDPWGLCVAPRHFAEHLEVLTRTRRLMPLRSLARAAARGRIPRGAVAITFDDGYADNYHVARPLLEQSDAPAAVFITTRYLGVAHEFWWDELDRIFLQPGTLPDILRLRFGAAPVTLELREAAEYSEADAHRNRGWRAWEVAPTPRQAAYLHLWERLYPLSAAEKQDLLHTLRCWAGTGSDVRASHRTLTHVELEHMVSGGLIDIGAHTLTHPPLGMRPLAEQRREIRESKADLEALLGRRVTSFSYPHGNHSAETVEEVRRAGYAVACTTAHQPVPAGADPLRFPRVQVMDGDGEALAHLLAE